MSRHAPAIPDGVPVLSRGRHRRPRKGACFMEMASFLAGEKWSDHPRCTHPVLASLARSTNDAVSDDTRQRLVPMIPEVVGLNPEDGRVAPVIVLQAAAAALRHANVERQNILALAILVAERGVGDCPGDLERSVLADAQEALDDVPLARRWAENFARRTDGRPIRLTAACRVAVIAVEGLADSGLPDAEDRMVALLRRAVTATQMLDEDREARTPAPAPPRSPLLARLLT